MKKPSNIDEYLASISEERRGPTEQIREAIQTAAPNAEEAFSYGIPGFRLEGRPLLWFGAWKHHYSLYPLTQAVLDAHGSSLASYETSKGTIKFPADQPLPLELVASIVRTRVNEIEEG